MRFRSGEFAGQSSTVTPWSLNQLLVPLEVWAGAKSCWKMKSASPWSLSVEGSMQCSKMFLVDGCVDCGLQKTQWTNTSRCHGNHHWLCKLHAGLQATWILCLFTLPPDSGTLISKWNAKFTFIWKEDFGPLSNSPVLFLLSPGKMLLTMFLFQKWLGSPFPEDVWAWWLLMHWLHFQFTPCEALPSVWIGFAWEYSQSLLLVHIFLPNFFLPVNFAFNMLWYSTPWTAPPFSNDPLWLTLFVEGVNDRLKYMKVSLFEIIYKKKMNFFTIFKCFRCTCRHTTFYLMREEAPVRDWYSAGFSCLASWSINK